VWSWCPDAGTKSCGDEPRDDGGNQARNRMLAALMGLVTLSARIVHDEAVGRARREKVASCRLLFRPIELPERGLLMLDLDKVAGISGRN
jgi:hypothetical protein